MCEGLIGKIFGHKYKEYLVSSEPQMQTFKDFEGSAGGICKLIDSVTSKQYVICCVRCGHQIKEKTNES